MRKFFKVDNSVADSKHSPELRWCHFIEYKNSIRRASLASWQWKGNLYKYIYTEWISHLRILAISRRQHFKEKWQWGFNSRCLNLLNIRHYYLRLLIHSIRRNECHNFQNFRHLRNQHTFINCLIFQMKKEASEKSLCFNVNFDLFSELSSDTTLFSRNKSYQSFSFSPKTISSNLDFLYSSIKSVPNSYPFSLVKKLTGESGIWETKVF